MKLTLLLLIPLLFLSSCLQQPTNNKEKTIVSSEFKTIGMMKDFGSGFTLRQNEEETTLSYSGKIIKTWSHNPPKEVPFIWDEACSTVWKGFEKLPPNEQSSGKQGVWDTLTEKEKKDCIKENLQNSIFIESSTGSTFNIRKTSYEGYTEWIYDNASGKLTEEVPGNIK